MKFGRRQGKGQDADPGVADAPPVAPEDLAPPVSELPDESLPLPPDSPFSSTWSPTGEPPAPVAESEPAPDVAEPPPALAEEPVVEGEAFELFTDEPPVAEPVHPPPPPPSMPIHHHEPAAAPPPPPPPPPAPEPMPFPVAEQPVAVVTPEAGPPVMPVTALGDAGEAFASGHAETPAHGGGPGPAWQEPVMALANERPELVVGAAFAGGLLFAMILRRLGN